MNLAIWSNICISFCSSDIQILKVRGFLQRLIILANGLEKSKLKCAHTESKHVCACSLCPCVLSCVRFCDPMDCSPSGSSVHVISQARILEWFASSFSRAVYKVLFSPFWKTDPCNWLSRKLLSGHWLLWWILYNSGGWSHEQCPPLPWPSYSAMKITLDELEHIRRRTAHCPGLSNEGSQALRICICWGAQQVKKPQGKHGPSFIASFLLKDWDYKKA